MSSYSLKMLYPAYIFTLESHYLFSNYQHQQSETWYNLVPSVPWYLHGMFTLMIQSNEMKLWSAQFGVLVGSCECSIRSRVLHFVYKCVFNQTSKNSRMHLRGWSFFFCIYIRPHAIFALSHSQGKELLWTPTKYKKGKNFPVCHFTHPVL